eukprot:3126791-Prymnesium_polylepis.1
MRTLEGKVAQYGIELRGLELGLCRLRRLLSSGGLFHHGSAQLGFQQLPLARNLIDRRHRRLQLQLGLGSFLDGVELRPLGQQLGEDARRHHLAACRPLHLAIVDTAPIRLDRGHLLLVLLPDLADWASEVALGKRVVPGGHDEWLRLGGAHRHG